MVCISKQEYEDRRVELRARMHEIAYKIKLNDSIKLIQKSFELTNNCVVAFSGGKDSLVVIDLVRKIKPDVVGIFENTGNEYSETVEYVKRFDNIIVLHPEMTFWECAKQYGLPEIKSKAKSHGNMCCKKLKEEPFKKYCNTNTVDLVFTGLTSDESRNRMMMLKRMGNLYWHKSEKIWKCHPIAEWTPEDVWNYIKQNNLEYNPIYDMGIPRCGCRFCTAYLSWKEITELYNTKDTQTLMKFKGYKTLDMF